MKKWHYKKFGGISHIEIVSGEDIASLAELDRKEFLAISSPVNGVRADEKMLSMIDTDNDGRIRIGEVIGAVDYLKSKGVDFNELLMPNTEELNKALDETLSSIEHLKNAPLTIEEKKAIEDWENKLAEITSSCLGENTADAEKALAKVEAIVDEYFVPQDDAALVTEEPKRMLPLKEKLNPRFEDDIEEFAKKCVDPILGDGVKELSRREWNQIKAKFSPYREHILAKPSKSAPEEDALRDEEKLIRLKLGFYEFLENFVNMSRLYDADKLAIFQIGMLRIDAKEMTLCFHVESESAHAALAAKSKCCILYLKLSRPSEKAVRNICAVVTAGKVGSLYVGRNGVFLDRDGKDWEAVVTKVVESQVSLMEAFWSPWRKIGEGIGAQVKKFLELRQTKATAEVKKGTEGAQQGGAAMASSVAAIGIAVGMLTAALASIIAAVSAMEWWKLPIAIAVVILAVSLPSVILTYFKLRARDLGAILNASGWAINKPMLLSPGLARQFTLEIAPKSHLGVLLVILALTAVAAALCSYFLVTV